jgi:hypothetical protein
MNTQTSAESALGWNVRASPKFTAHLSFILLFPGFFIYQTLLGIGAISAVLGGYFTAVALALFLPILYSFTYALKHNRDYASCFELYLSMFVVYYLFILCINFLGGATQIIVERYVQSIIFCFETYVMFRALDLEDKKLLKILTISLLLMSAITFYFSVGGFFFLQGLDEAKDPESLATYQGFARSYIYTYLLLISTARSTLFRYLLYAVGTSSMFINGARSEFSAVLFLIPVIELYRAKYKLCMAFAIAFFSLIFVASIASIVDMLPDNRILQLLDLSHSTSAITRHHFTENAIRTISSNPFFGDFASYPDGHYAHNALCAWVDFGFFGFLFFWGLLAWPGCWLVFNGFFEKRQSNDFVLAGSLICITILWALTAKNVPDMSVGAAMGAFARYRYLKCNGMILE